MWISSLLVLLIVFRKDLVYHASRKSIFGRRELESCTGKKLGGMPQLEILTYTVQPVGVHTASNQTYMTASSVTAFVAA